MSEKVFGSFIGTAVVWTIMIVVFGGMYGCPKYNDKKCPAKLNLQKQNRIDALRLKKQKQILKLNAQAEVERAKGAAEAIKIENGSITPAYIQYLWVRQQNNLNGKTVIYIPTETNLPVLEASRNK